MPERLRQTRGIDEIAIVEFRRGINAAMAQHPNFIPDEAGSYEFEYGEGIVTLSRFSDEEAGVFMVNYSLARTNSVLDIHGCELDHDESYWITHTISAGAVANVAGFSSEQYSDNPLMPTTWGGRVDTRSETERDMLTRLYNNPGNDEIMGEVIDDAIDRIEDSNRGAFTYAHHTDAMQLLGKLGLPILTS